MIRKVAIPLQCQKQLIGSKQPKLTWSILVIEEKLVHQNPGRIESRIVTRATVKISYIASLRKYHWNNNFLPTRCPSIHSANFRDTESPCPTLN